MRELFQKLKNPDPAQRTGAIAELARLDHVEAHQAIVRSFLDPDEEVRLASRRVLAALGKERVIPLLDSMLVSQKRWKQEAALLAAPRLPSSGSVALLEKAYHLDDPELESLALDGLTHMSRGGHAGAVAALHRIHSSIENFGETEVPAAESPFPRADPVSEGGEAELPVELHGSQIALTVTETDACRIPLNTVESLESRDDSSNMEAFQHPVLDFELERLKSRKSSRLDVPVEHPSGRIDLRGSASSSGGWNPNKSCPTCSEWILQESKFCDFCGHSFESTKPLPDITKNDRPTGSMKAHPTPFTNPIDVKDANRSFTRWQEIRYQLVNGPFIGLSVGFGFMGMGWTLWHFHVSFLFVRGMFTIGAIIVGKTCLDHAWK